MCNDSHDPSHWRRGPSRSRGPAGCCACVAPRGPAAAGVAPALELFGIPRLLGVPVVALALWWIIVAGSSERVERIFVTLTVFFFAFIISAIMAQPDWGAALRSTVVPTTRWDAEKLLLVVATVGTTVTPFMQFILQSSVVERGVTIRRYKRQLQDVILGSTFA